MMPLPPMLYRAKTVKVLKPSLLTVSVELGFAVSVIRTVKIEGAPDKDLPICCRDAAMHCATVLLGGKRLVIRYHDTDSEKVQVVRVYLDEKVFGSPPGFVSVSNDLDHVLDVGVYLSSLVPSRFSVADVRKTLNGGTQ